MSWKQKILQLAADADGLLDNARHLIKKRLGTNEKIQIVPYRSYGTASRIFCRGRLMEDSGIQKSEASDSNWQNLVNMYRRFETDELPGESITLSVLQNKYSVLTNHEGYFYFDIPLEQPLPVHAGFVELPLTASVFGQQVNATAEILIPQANAQYGIISDIDDTIIETGATSIIGMLKTVLLTNANTRLPLEGVADFYTALQKGKDGNAHNPFFYVSNGPWNLYDLLIDFMEIQQLPQGPLLLRDFGIRSPAFVNNRFPGHKFHEIKQVLHTYPHLPFVLIGDSGEDDPAIYYEVVKNFPGRIRAVYLREVQDAGKKTVAIEMVEKISNLEVPVLLTGSTKNILGHAASIGLM